MKKITSLLVTAVFLSACGQEQAATAPEVVEVGAYTVAAQSLAPVTQYATRIAAFESADIVARVTGRVLERHVEGGEQVTRGAPLLSLDRTDTELALQDAEAKFAIEQANLAESQRNFDRGERLQETGAIAAIQMDELATNLQNSQASVQAAEAALEYARVQLGYTTVSAPLDGVVGLVNVSVGDLVGPSSGPVLTISRQDAVLTDIAVGEADMLTYMQRSIAGEEPTFDIRLRLANDTIYDLQGSVFSYADQANPATGTVTVRVLFDNPDGLLLPGQSATVLVSETGNDAQIAVPQAAVQQDQRGAFVMLVDSDMTIAQRYLQTGEQVDGWWLIEDGLAEGDQVVTEGLQKIRPGSVVTVAE